MNTSPSPNLTSTPEIIDYPTTPLVYVEKTGPFMEKAPLAWQEFWMIAGPQLDKSLITNMTGLSRIDNTKQGDEAFIYQAGVMVKDKPAALPQGLHYRLLPGARFACFLLTGPYMQLIQAYPAAIEHTLKAGHSLRDDFFMEIYLNTPLDTPEADLKTQIFVPIA